MHSLAGVLPGVPGVGVEFTSKMKECHLVAQQLLSNTNQLETSIKVLDTHISSVVAGTEFLREENKQLVAELSNTQTANRRARKQLVDKLLNNSLANMVLTDKVKQGKKTLMAKDGELTSKDKELKAKDEELAAKQDEIEGLTEQNATFQSVIRTSQIKHDAFDSEIRKQRAFVDGLSEEKGRLELALAAANQEIDTLRGEKQGLIEHVQGLERAKDELENQRADTVNEAQVAAEAEVVKIWREKNAMEETIRGLRAELQESKSKEGVNGEVDGVGRLAQAEIDRFKSIITEHKAFIIDLQAQIHNLVTEKQAYFEARDARNVEIAEVNIENDTLFANLQTRITSLTDQLQQATTGTLAEALLTQHTAITSQLDQLLYENHTLVFQMNNYIKEKSEMAGEQDREEYRRARDRLVLLIRIAVLEDEKKKIQNAFHYVTKNGAEVNGPAYEKI